MGELLDGSLHVKSTPFQVKCYAQKAKKRENKKMQICS